MEATRGDAGIVVDGARQRLHDARGYGRPLDGDRVALAPVEAAHLLYRGDLDAVDGDGFAAFFEAMDDAARGPRFLVYADLRSRGFYLSPAIEGWPPGDLDGVDFAVYTRGTGPREGDIAYRVRTVGERALTPAADLGDLVLAVVDEEGEVTYFETTRPTPSGTESLDPPRTTAAVLGDRVVAWDAPAALYRDGFYGQPLAGGDVEGGGPLQLSLVEAAHLAAAGALDVPGGVDAIREQGRRVEGDRFDRRLAAYVALREAGVVPKTGFKFGADFRTYPDFEHVDDLGHSADLVRVVPPNHAFAARELALDVRLAGGVRKRTLFAVTSGTDAVDWLAVTRLTP